MYKRILSYRVCFPFLISYFLISGCAQIVVPSGGPKDLKAPRVEKYVPDSAATNFTAKTITIIFDEYIQLADLQKEMTISPPMRVQPEVRAKGKMLQLELKDTLKDNTTYVINFGSSIRDFTEANAKNDFRYIFSTGKAIDTLKLTGVVKGAYDQKTEKGVLVMLYETHDDSLPYKTGPSYFAKTSADGTYKISNIRPGKYKAFALKDANSNYRYDVPTESIGFSDTLIKISKNTKLDLRLFVEEPKRQYLLKKFVAGYGRMMLLYSKPIGNISYRALNKTTQTETFLTEYNTGRDSIRVWFPVFSKDSLFFKIIADEKVIDTIKIGTGQFQKEGTGRGEAVKLNATLNVKKDQPLDLNKMLELHFNHPIKTYTQKFELKHGNVFLHHGNLNTKKDSAFLMRKWPVRSDKAFTIGIAAPLRDSIGEPLFDSLGSPIIGVGPFTPDTGTYSLFIPPGTFTDIFGFTNDTVKVDFRSQEEKFYGTLKLTLKMKYRIPFVLELINEKGIVFNYARAERGTFSYLFMAPGAYKLRVIYDQNGDGKWNTGNYLEKKKPETIIYYPGAVTIRSNWDLELDWKVE